ncbi:GNAT family N-acetyltransferase [Allofournierella sp.]|uniref:GNAT family N-acetyltransferase n=1 Tax=Allofournierella sp. TaxID=1940256 RepID=UPI003AB29888
MRVEQRQENGLTRFVLYKEALVVGGCACRAEGGGTELLELSVLPEWRRKGYGSYLLKEVLRATGGYGPRSLHTAPAPENAAAQTLLKKFGFAPRGACWARRRAADPTAVGLTHAFLERTLALGGFFVDATCGNGNDTEFLCRLAGPGGRVLALDVQQKAVDATNARLAAAGLAEVGRAVRADHARLGQLVHRGSADCVVFNFGYLPGADHALFTVPQSSLPAVEAALEALKPGGVLAACLYSGGPNGSGEKRALLEYFRGLPPAGYTLLVCEFANWAPTAPLPCFVLKK